MKLIKENRKIFAWGISALQLIISAFAFYELVVVLPAMLEFYAWGEDLSNWPLETIAVISSATFTTYSLPIGFLVLGLLGLKWGTTKVWALASTLFSLLTVLVSWIPMFVESAKYSFSPVLVFGFRSVYEQGLRNLLIENISESVLPTINMILVLLVSIALVVLLISSMAVREERVQRDPKNISRVSGKQGFFYSLFDFSFEKFIYVKVSRFIYAVILALVALWNVFLFFAVLLTLVQNPWQLVQNPWYVFLIPASLIVSMLTVIFVRLGLESGVALIKIAENTQKTK